MPLKPSPINLDDLYRLRLAGESIERIAAYFHTTKPRIRNLLVTEGLPLRCRADELPYEHIMSLYASGSSSAAIATQYSCSIFTILGILRKHGIAIRDGSSARTLAASQQTPEQRQARARAAHMACTGRHRTPEELMHLALCKERRGTFDSPDEQRLYELLVSIGLVMRPQVASGPFNIDLAAYPIAVEICGSGRFVAGEMRTRYLRKFRHLLNEQWLVVVVWATWDGQTHCPIDIDAAHHIAALMQESRLNPPIGREYRMIGSHGELLAVGSRDTDQLPFVVPSRASKGLWSYNPRTRH